MSTSEINPAPMKTETKQWLSREYLIFIGLLLLLYIISAIGNIKHTSNYFWESEPAGEKIFREINPPQLIPPSEYWTLNHIDSLGWDYHMSPKVWAQRELWKKYQEKLTVKMKMEYYLYLTYTVPLSPFLITNPYNEVKSPFFLTPRPYEIISVIYAILWLPRLTIRAIRTVRDKN